MRPPPPLAADWGCPDGLSDIDFLIMTKWKWVFVRSSVLFGGLLVMAMVVVEGVLKAHQYCPPSGNNKGWYSRQTEEERTEDEELCLL